MSDTGGARVNVPFVNTGKLVVDTSRPVFCICLRRLESGELVSEGVEIRPPMLTLEHPSPTQAGMNSTWYTWSFTDDYLVSPLTKIKE